MPLTIIRPLCLCEESDIRIFAEQQNYRKLLKQCHYEHETSRTAIHEIFLRMQQLNKETRYSIWNALKAAGKLTEY
jgi:tRNA(Ile)-lysidine synthase TilS/MesJ